MRGGRIALFGGTTEGRLLAKKLTEEGFEGVLLVATEYGALLAAGEGGACMPGAGKNGACMPAGRQKFRNGENASAGIRVHAGRLDQAQMEALFSQERVGLAIDATHPYAVRATANIREACRRTGVLYLRCIRGETPGAGGNPEALPGERMVRFPDMARAAEWLKETEGNILLTTGSRDLAAFSGIDRERMYVRVLPAERSLAACREQGYTGRHVIAMQGPFSEELNLALLREFSCRILVTKDGGSQGGFEEKRRAAARAGAVFAVVERPGETGFSMEEVIKRAREWRNNETGRI